MSDMSIDRITFLLNANREAGRKLQEELRRRGQGHDKAKADECKPTRPSVIAVIDDNPEILEALDLMLSSCGYRPELFASAEEFLNVAATSDAACLVVDIQLGDISGVELGRELFAKGSHSRLYSSPGLGMNCTGGRPLILIASRFCLSHFCQIG
jgi:CheY-like chemotaxis protein